MYTPGTLNQLLEIACPSIQYRTRIEILGHDPESKGMPDLQSEIQEDPLVIKVFGWRGVDGWLGQGLHGYGSIEAGIRILCEKGLSRDHPVLAGALNALEERTDRLHLGIGKVGKLLDEMGLGGSRMIRAAVYAKAGEEDKDFVRDQIRVALEGFGAVLEVHAIEDILDEYQGKRVFRPGVTWPGIYHLRLLAFTHSWRTLQNQQMIADSIKRLVQLSPIPVIHARHKSQLMAPCSFCMDNFNPDLGALDEAAWMMWFHRMEMLARLGIMGVIPELGSQIETLRSILTEGDGWFTRRLSHSYFSNWGAYSGLMLEQDWRSPKRRTSDLTFRSLLILRYAENQP
jgi:hypothetical protein